MVLLQKKYDWQCNWCLEKCGKSDNNGIRKWIKQEIKLVGKCKTEQFDGTGIENIK